MEWAWSMGKGRFKPRFVGPCGGGVHGQGDPMGTDASEGKGPRRRPQRRLGRRLEEVAEAVGGGYCRLQMPLKLALGVTGIVAGHRLGALDGGVPPPPPSNAALPAGQA